MPVLNPYESVLKRFNKSKVNYVLIGVSGINYYVNDPGDLFSTQDCDVLVKPEPKNLFLALKALESGGFKLEVNHEPIGTVDLWLTKRMIEQAATINAMKEGLRIDIVCSAGKIPYKDWFRTKRHFHIDKMKIPVGGLLQLLRAKENSNREKDRIFLKLYKVKLKDLLDKRRKS